MTVRTPSPFVRIVPVLAVVCLFSFTVQARYSGGSGTALDPYQIATAADLIALGEDSNDYDKHFVLTADIDLDPDLPGRKIFEKAVIAPDTDDKWGFQGTRFAGVFDGRGHTISHLTIAAWDYVGLLGQLGPGAEVKNLGLVEARISSANDGVGSLVGTSYGAVTQCHYHGAISGHFDVGGLVGYNYGTVIQCYGTGVVNGLGGFVGGLVGTNGGTVTRCYSTGTVSSPGGQVGSIGGLVGSNGVSIQTIGGVFVTRGTLGQCYSTANVGGPGAVGGLAGDNSGAVTNCYTTGAVSSTGGRVGGLVGDNAGTVADCYSTGAVDGAGDGVGGLVGYAHGVSVAACFWDTQTSGQATSAGGAGKATSEMQRAKIFLDAGWDFVGETANGMDDVWKIAEGLGYPRLAWEKYNGGSGTVDDPYQIATVADLIALGQAPPDYDKHFVLTADIDLDPNLPGRKVFDKAVIAPGTNVETPWSFEGTAFTGVFDGEGHTISHLTINGEAYLGLFGLLGVGGDIRDLGVDGVQVSGSSYYVGGLVGLNKGAVRHCHSAGRVSGATGNGVGGLAGENDGLVIGCYSTCTVSGGTHWAVGGLVGHNDGAVAQCYSSGTVRSGERAAGGLVGSNWGAVTHCYCAGVVDATYAGGLVGFNAWRGTVSQCYSTATILQGSGGLIGENNYGAVTPSFWDIQTSHRSSSVGGTGKTTAEMQDIQIYLDAGWDFVNEVENGLHEVWQIPEGGGYPVLAIFNGYAAPRLRGTGTPEDPFIISNARGLGAVVYGNPYAHYRLTAAIDLSGVRWGTAVIPWFAGTFDGAGRTISHLTIEGGSYLGLFGQLAGGAEVKDLGLADVHATGSTNFIGGLVGENHGNVARCFSTGSLSGSEWDGPIGGLAGANNGAVICCYSTAAVAGEGQQCVGGLVGQNPGTIASSYSTGSVAGGQRAGGLVGYNGDPTVEAHKGIVTCSFWDTQSSGQVASGSGTGKTTAEMQTAKTFLDTGWDFMGETANGTEDVWWISEGPNYPRLSWESRRYGGGRGEPNDPYLIFTAQQMNAIGTEPNDWDKHFQLGADLDLAGFDGQAGRPEFHPIGTGYNKAFVGVFDGLGHTVRNFSCHMDKGQGVGLFGFLGPHGEVKDLVIQDANVSGDSYVGALVGYNHRGTVRHCRATGHVQGNQYTGGLIGICIDQALTERCHSEVYVSGWSPTGGLVGANSGSTVSQCAVTGTVKGAGGGGITGRQDNHSLIQDSYSVCTMSGGGSGIAGANRNSLVSRCYFAGVFVCPEPRPLRDARTPISVAASECGSGLVGFNTDGQVEASFWDIQTSGATTSAGGTGKTTVEMQTASTFLDAGWDFVDEAANGTEDVWWIDEGKDYPRLWWERPGSQTAEEKG